jgi:hypothetical protein
MPSSDISTGSLCHAKLIFPALKNVKGRRDTCRTCRLRLITGDERGNLSLPDLILKLRPVIRLSELNQQICALIFGKRNAARNVEKAAREHQ